MASVNPNHVQPQVRGPGYRLVEIGYLQGHVVDSLAFRFQEANEEIVGCGIGERFNEFKLASSRKKKLNPAEPACKMISAIAEPTLEQGDERKGSPDAVNGDRNVIETLDDVSQFR